DLQDLVGVVDVEPPEVDQLAGGVDLGLPCGLGLTQHGRGVQPLAPGTGEQLRSTQEDRGALVEGEVAPGRGGLAGGGDRRAGVGFGAGAQQAEHVLMVVRLDDRDLGAPAEPLLPADRGGQLVLGGPEACDLGLQRRPLGTAGGVVQVGLVDRCRGPCAAVHPAMVSEPPRGSNPLAGAGQTSWSSSWVAYHPRSWSRQASSATAIASASPALRIASTAARAAGTAASSSTCQASMSRSRSGAGRPTPVSGASGSGAATVTSTSRAATRRRAVVGSSAAAATSSSDSWAAVSRAAYSHSSSSPSGHADRR